MNDFITKRKELELIDEQIMHLVTDRISLVQQLKEDKNRLKLETYQADEQARKLELFKSFALKHKIKAKYMEDLYHCLHSMALDIQEK